MIDIYRAAKQTILWLGTPDDESAFGLRSIELHPKVNAREFDDDRLLAIHDILQRPYWMRVWVIQEALCSRNAIVRCSFDTLDFEHVYYLPAFLPHTETWAEVITAVESRDSWRVAFPFNFLLRRLEVTKYDPKSNPLIQLTLLEMMDLAEYFMSTLPRDRIFALLGIASPSDRATIRPDYSPDTSDRQIFSRLTLHFMRLAQPAKALELLWPRKVNKSIDLPSWVPEWTVPSLVKRVQPGPSSQSFAAGQDQAAWADLASAERVCPLGVSLGGHPIHFCASHDGEILIVLALVVDHIASTHSPLPDPGGVENHSLRDTDVPEFGACVARALRDCRVHAEKYPNSPYRSPHELVAALGCAIRDFAPLRKDVTPLLVAARSADRDADMCSLTTITDTTRQFQLDASIRGLGACLYRTFVVTDKGYVGSFPCTAKSGDVVSVSPDSTTPFRPESSV